MMKDTQDGNQAYFCPVSTRSISPDDGILTALLTAVEGDVGEDKRSKRPPTLMVKGFSSE